MATWSNLGLISITCISFGNRLSVGFLFNCNSPFVYGKNITQSANADIQLTATSEWCGQAFTHSVDSPKSDQLKQMATLSLALTEVSSCYRGFLSPTVARCLLKRSWVSLYNTWGSGALSTGLRLFVWFDATEIKMFEIDKECIETHVRFHFISYLFCNLSLTQGSI